MSKKLKLILLVASILIFHDQTPAQVNEGLVGYWSFDDSTAIDNSGHEQHGTIYGDPQPVQGVLGTAFKFYGNQYVQILDSDILDTDSSMTISLWIKPDSFASEGSKFMCKWYSSPEQGDWLFSTSSRDSCGKYLGWAAKIVNYKVYGVNDGYLSIGNTDTSNFLKFRQWNHIAVSFDTGYAKSYYNGVLLKRDTSNIKYTSLSEYSTDDIYIGRYRKNYPNYYFFGSLDEIRIYNRALQDNEIHTLYISAITHIPEQRPNKLVQNFRLFQNYPNPFNPVTTISWQLPISNHVDLSIYNLLGQKLVTLVNEKQSAGMHETVFDASSLTSGIYIYKLIAGSFEQTRKMVVLR